MTQLKNLILRVEKGDVETIYMIPYKEGDAVFFKNGGILVDENDFTRACELMPSTPAQVAFCLMSREWIAVGRLVLAYTKDDGAEIWTYD